MLTLEKVLNRDHPEDTRWIVCGWADCTKPGYELHKTLFHDHNPGFPCNDARVKHVWYIFCSDKHKNYFLHSHIKLGNLPPGARNSF
jgi:hypothetical protein